jgi:hypothetical protein
MHYATERDDSRSTAQKSRRRGARSSFETPMIHLDGLIAYQMAQKAGHRHWDESLKTSAPFPT